MISAFSVISAIGIYSIMLLIAGVLWWLTPFLKRGGVHILLILTGFAVLRLILPIETSITHAVRWDGLGKLHIFLRTHETLTEVFKLVWIIGAIVVIGLYIFKLYRAKEWSSRYIAVKDERVQKIAQRLSAPCSVVVSPDVDTPYVAGVIHPTIYFPVLDFSDRWIEMAMAHEIQHIRTRDLAIKLFFGFIMAVMWWNPINFVFFFVLDAMLEMRCDMQVTAGMSDHEQCEYGEMLKDLADQLAKSKRKHLPMMNISPAVWYTRLSLTRRVKVAVSSKPSRNLCVVAVCLILALFCGSYLVVFQAATEPPEEYFVEEPEVYYDDNYDGPELGDGVNKDFVFVGTDGRYRLFVDYEFSRYLSDDEIASGEYDDFVFEEKRER